MARRQQAAVAGHRGDEPTARRLLADPEPKVRSTALGALARMDRLSTADVVAATADADATVRARAAELAAAFEVDLIPMLMDQEASVVEAACWALGERSSSDPGVVAALCRVATDHADPLCREAAVAALGAIGDEAAIDTIIRATEDKPAVRRRSVLALAPFEGPAVEAALRRALTDRDWQVRQAAEDLLADD